jgi:hypothetical protein
MRLILMLVICVFIVAYVGATTRPQASRQEHQETPEEIASRRAVEAKAAKELARQQKAEDELARQQGTLASLAAFPPEITLAKVDMSYGRFEGDVIVKNPNTVAIRDVRVTCDVIAPSGTIIHHYQFTIYERIPAKGQKAIRNYNFGFWPQQGKSVACSPRL